MPTYEYECKTCAHNFEIFQSMSDQPVKDCPQCGKEVRRLIFGGSGVIFKGSGFYVTDKSKSSKTQTKSSDAGKIETKTDAAASPCSNCPQKGASASCPAQ
jgi:putative FmdB family regulatory protein